MKYNIKINMDSGNSISYPIESGDSLEGIVDGAIDKIKNEKAFAVYNANRDNAHVINVVNILSISVTKQ